MSVRRRRLSFSPPFTPAHRESVCANRKDPEGLFYWMPAPNKDYFLAAGFAAFLGAATLGACGFAGAAFGAAVGSGAATGAVLSAVRWSRRTLISSLSLSLRSVNFAMLAVSFAISLAVLETGAFAGAFATGFAAGAGVVTFTGVGAAFAAAFFAVAIR